MNESQIDALQIVLNNPVILGALYQVFQEELKESLPKVDGESNEVIGQKYRAYELSKQIISDAFTTLNGYQKSREDGQKNTRHI